MTNQERDQVVRAAEQDATAALLLLDVIIDDALLASPASDATITNDVHPVNKRIGRLLRATLARQTASLTIAQELQRGAPWGAGSAAAMERLAAAQ